MSMMLSDTELTVRYIEVLNKWKEWAKQCHNDEDEWQALKHALKMHKERYQELWES